MIDICSESEHVPLSIVYVNRYGLPATVKPVISKVLDIVVFVASVQVPKLLSCEPSRASNRLNGEFAAKSFSQKVWFTATPAFGSASTITCTVVDSSGQGLGNKF